MDIPIAGYNARFSVSSLPSVSFTNEATTDDGTHMTYTISNAAKRYFDKDAATVVQVGHDELQTVTITGTPTGGTFTLTFGANTTSPIAYNAVASAVQSALQALASIGPGNALVSGGPGPGTPYVVRFTASLGLSNVTLMTASGAGLTGGSSPSVNVVETQAGSAYTTTTTGFTLFRVNARVVFASAQALGTQVRFSSGKYLPYSQFGQAKSCEFAGKIMMLLDTVFGTADGAKTYIPGLLEGTMKTGSYWMNHARVNSLLARDLLIVDFEAGDGTRYEGYCHTSQTNIKSSQDGKHEQELEFQLSDDFFAA